MKKVLCLVLAALMLCTALSACSGGRETPQEEGPDDSNISGYLKGTNSFGCELKGELTVIDMTGIELGSDKAFQIMSGDVKLTGTFTVTKYKIEFGNGDGSRTANIDMSELSFDTSRLDASALDPDKSIIMFGSYGTELSATSPANLPENIEIQKPATVTVFALSRSHSPNRPTLTLWSFMGPNSGTKLKA